MQILSFAFQLEYMVLKPHEYEQCAQHNQKTEKITISSKVIFRLRSTKILFINGSANLLNLHFLSIFCNFLKINC